MVWPSSGKDTNGSQLAWEAAPPLAWCSADATLHLPSRCCRCWCLCLCPCTCKPFLLCLSFPVPGGLHPPQDGPFPLHSLTIPAPPFFPFPWRASSSSSESLSPALTILAPSFFPFLLLPLFLRGLTCSSSSSTSPLTTSTTSTLSSAAWWEVGGGRAACHPHGRRVEAVLLLLLLLLLSRRRCLRV